MLWTLVLGPQDEPWPRHTIDASSRGADGVRVADANGDGRLDVVTAWEEGGEVRVYLQPEGDALRAPWPRVMVGRVRSPEDAVFVDLDGDGGVDVVSSCEGRERAVYAHWAPAERERLLDPEAWSTAAFPAARGHAQWMFAEPMDVDGSHGVDLVIGAKNEGACVAWLEAPAQPRALEQWRLHVIEPAGWIMSLRALERDEPTLLVSDRRGERRGVYALQAERGASGLRWTRQNLLGAEHEVMFLDCARADGEGALAVATRDGELLLRDADGELAYPNPHGHPWGKALRYGDLDLDGDLDLALSHRVQGGSSEPGLVWLERTPEGWRPRPLSDAAGKKFDRLELVDLDGDGDLDLLTTEEVEGLGVVWYENPLRSPRSR